MLIAIDHGNRLCKGAHMEPFISGLTESEVEPFGPNVLKYRNRYYQLTDQRIPYRRDKTEDDRFFILTLFGIAKEIEAQRGYCPGIIRVQLAVGLPPAHYGSGNFGQQGRRKAQFLTSAILQYIKHPNGPEQLTAPIGMDMSVLKHMMLIPLGFICDEDFLKLALRGHILFHMVHGKSQTFRTAGCGFHTGDPAPPNLHIGITGCIPGRFLDSRMAHIRGKGQSERRAAPVMSTCTAWWIRPPAYLLNQVRRWMGTTLRGSVYAQICWAISMLGLADKFRCTVSPMECTYLKTGQKIMFFSLDDPGKLKSIKIPFGYIGIGWFEELDQFDGPEQIRNVEQSIFRGGPFAFCFKSFNPPAMARNWANQYVREKKERQLIHHSTYATTPESWLGPKFLNDARHLKETNETAYRYEYGGEVVGGGTAVFENLRLEPITDKQITDFAYGFRMREARKGPGSVTYGIKWLQSLPAIVIDPTRCPETAKEFSEYEYGRDPKTGEVLEGCPDATNHSIDAVRYAMEPVWRRSGR